MSFFEILLVSLLVVLIGGAFLRAYRAEDPTVFWNPLTLFSAVFAYYFVVGPLLALAGGNTTAYGMDLRDLMWKSWLAGLLGLGSIFAGFAIRARRFRTRLTTATPLLRQRMKIFFGILAALGLLGFAYDAYVSGQSIASMLLPFHGGPGGDPDLEGRAGLAAGNYLFLLINVFIPGMCLMVALQSGQSRGRRFLFVVLPAVQVIFFYASMGFRHRIVILILSMAATAHLLRRRRPNLLMLGLSAIGILLIAGLIVVTRTYGQGLDLSQAAGMSAWDLVLSGFNDSGTFFTMGLVINSFPSAVPYVGLDPLWVALTIPIPRELWPDKPYPIFLEHFQYLTGTRGQGVPITGEHYMMAGWAGIIMGGLIVGMLYRGFWEFYRANPRNPLVVVMYAVSWGLIFPVVNRGYLAQTLMEFFFDFLPLVLLYLASKKLMLVTGRAGSVASTPGRLLRLVDPRLG